MFKIAEILQATGGKLINGNKNNPIKKFSTDSRSIKKGEAFIALRGNNFDGHAFIGEALKKGASCIIKVRSTEYGVQSRDIAVVDVEDTIKALGDIARYNRKIYNIPVIAITGSNGKTTTKEMVAWVLSAKFRVLKNEGTKNNNIGLPQTLLNLDKNFDLVVLELGSNHPGEIGYLAGIAKPNMAVITNIGSSHLEYFSDLGGVFNEKYSLLQSLDKPHIALLNADDDFLNKVSRDSKKNPFVLSFGINNRAAFSASLVKHKSKRLEFLINSEYKLRLSTPGEHNIYNALAAAACARMFGMDYRQIAKRLASFEFPKGRLKVIDFDKTTIIDDTYNSNPLSFKEAVRALDSYAARGRKIVVMGDMLELGKDKEALHRRAGIEASEVCDVVITVGELAKLAAEAAKEKGISEIFICRSALDARNILFNTVSPGKEDVVLIKGSRSMKMEEVFI